jgi:protein-disulfide isomerase
MKQLTISVNSNDHLFGNPNATLELVEYGDYECPYCGRAYPIVNDIKKLLDGDIKFVFRNFPLSKIHPHAFMAAVATEAAGLQGKFWEMHDMVFENQKSLNEENINHFASLLGLDADRFKEDIQNRLLFEKVEKDFESGLRSGVNKTPTFFINGQKFDGDWSKGELLDYLKAQLDAIPINKE